MSIFQGTKEKERNQQEEEQTVEMAVVVVPAFHTNVIDESSPSYHPKKATHDAPLGEGYFDAQKFDASTTGHKLDKGLV